MNKRPAQQSTRVIEGQERPKGLPATIRKIDGRWFGDARAVFEGVQVNFIYFGVNDHVGRGAFQGHTHPFSELFYTLSGSGRTLHSGRSEVCPEGHIFVARPGYAHSSEWSAAPGHPWRGLIIQFDINLESDRLDARSDLRLAQTFAPFFDYFFIRRETSLQLGRPTRSQLRQSAARMLARLRGYPECGSAWIVNFWIELMAMMAVDLRRRAVKAGQGLVIQYSQKSAA
jgi:mannose-6-phosphate isomerase-like protein (cupin superfamily)